MLVVRVLHGLGNRLRALASARALAESANMRLAICWSADLHLNATFFDLYEPPKRAMRMMVYSTCDDKALMRRHDVSTHSLISVAPAPGGRGGKGGKGGKRHAKRKKSLASASRRLDSDQLPATGATGDGGAGRGGGGGGGRSHHRYVVSSRRIEPIDLALHEGDLPHLVNLTRGAMLGHGCGSRCRLSALMARSLHMLTPVEPVRRLVYSLAERWVDLLRLPALERLSEPATALLSRRLLAVHIRSEANLSVDVPGIQQAADPRQSVRAMEDMPKHRRRCHWSSFLPHAKEMAAEMVRAVVPAGPTAADSSDSREVMVYVASDTLRAAAAFCDALRLPAWLAPPEAAAAAPPPHSLPRSPHSPPRPPRDIARRRANTSNCVTLPAVLSRPCLTVGSARRGVACVRLALVELTLLAMSHSFLFSDASSFSSIAVILGKSSPSSMREARSGCAAPITATQGSMGDKVTLALSTPGSAAPMLEGLYTRPVRDVRPWWLAGRRVAGSILKQLAKEWHQLSRP